MKKINKKRLINLIVIVLLLVLYYFLVRLNIFVIECPFKRFFNVYCSGCGVSRMLISITEFKFIEAFYYNRLFFILLPFIIILFIDFVISYLFEKNNKIINKIPISIYILIGIIIVIFGVIRNIEFFDYLSPIFID